MDVLARFLRYSKINTTTNPQNGAAGIMPSTPGQMELAKLLKMELEELGLLDIKLEDSAILTATLPANTDIKLPTVAFFAHLDTSVENKNDTKAKVQRYEGGDLCLNEELGIFLRASEFKELEGYIGDDIVTTDGTSLLGADDKAAIAAIMSALASLINNPDIKHGEVKVGFLPDEEQGLRGAKAFDVASFGADFGYTLDCCGIGEIVYENWNAGNAYITFKGQSAHPMSAKGKLKNSLLMAHKFISMLPAGEAPEYTEGLEGYYWVKNMQGTSALTQLVLDIRDFTKEGYAARMSFLGKLATSLEELWGEGSILCRLEDRYANVADSLQGEKRYPVDIALAAYKNCNIAPKPVAMRGGYDGAVLSQKGLPCPNLFTGAHNFHSIYEYLPVSSLKAASAVLIEITKQVLLRFKDK